MLGAWRPRHVGQSRPPARAHRLAERAASNVTPLQRSRANRCTQRAQIVGGHAVKHPRRTFFKLRGRHRADGIAAFGVAARLSNAASTLDRRLRSRHRAGHHRPPGRTAALRATRSTIRRREPAGKWAAAWQPRMSWLLPADGYMLLLAANAMQSTPACIRACSSILCATSRLSA